MTDDEDLVVLATILGALQEPEFRRWRIARYGREVELPGGCWGEIMDDGALVCIAHNERMRHRCVIEWMDA